MRFSIQKFASELDKIEQFQKFKLINIRMNDEHTDIKDGDTYGYQTLIESEELVYLVTVSGVHINIYKMDNYLSWEMRRNLKQTIRSFKPEISFEMENLISNSSINKLNTFAIANLIKSIYSYITTNNIEYDALEILKLGLYDGELEFQHKTWATTVNNTYYYSPLMEPQKMVTNLKKLNDTYLYTGRMKFVYAVLQIKENLPNWSYKELSLLQEIVIYVIESQWNYWSESEYNWDAQKHHLELLNLHIIDILQEKANEQEQTISVYNIDSQILTQIDNGGKVNIRLSQNGEYEW